MIDELEEKRVRVLHVITQLELGGAQENTLHTVRRLNRDRFEVGLVAGAGGALDEEARSIPDLDLTLLPDLVREVRPWRDLRALQGLVRVMRRFKPDIVHTHSSKAGILGRLAARLGGVRGIVHSIHGFGFTPGQSAPVFQAFLAAERLAAPLTSHFIAVSRTNLAEGLRRGLYTRERISLVRSGVPLIEFSTGVRDRRAVRVELGFEPDCLLVGGVSCLKPQKDPLTFAETAARVLAVLPGARFCLAGDGELRPALERRLSRLGIADKVRLLGWRRDVARLFRAFDVLLHTSRWEGLPRVLPQAMAAGIPVVATRVDGSPEAVRHGETGFLARPGDAAALAGYLIRLLEDRDLRLALGHRGLRLVDEFDLRFLVPGQERVYRRLGAQAA